MGSFWATIWDTIWWFLTIFIFVAYLMALFSIITDLFRDRKLSGVAKAIWLLFLIFLPFLTALAYLIVVGSLLTFSAYIWLLRVSSPARVATYAYVNPVVAVLLGWFVADEQLTPQTIVAALLIVGGVALIITAGQRGT